MNPKQNKEQKEYQQAVDDWVKIGESLEWTYLRAGSLMPQVCDSETASDMRVSIHDAIQLYNKVGGLKPFALKEKPLTQDSETSEVTEPRKRGPKRDSFLRDDIDKEAFIRKLRALIEQRFEPKGKHGIIHMGEMDSRDLEPSKYFACLFAALIDHNIAKKSATPKGFDRLLHEVIEGSTLRGIFHLHYTSFNNVINGWLDLCKKEVQQACTCHTKKLIFELRCEDMDGLAAQKKLSEWKLWYSYVESTAAQAKLYGFESAS